MNCCHSIALILIVLMVAVTIDGQRRRGDDRENGQTAGSGRPRGRAGRGGQTPGGRGRGRFPRLPKEGVDRYSWNVTLESGTKVKQRAFAIPEKDVVTIITKSRQLRGVNMTSSVVLMNTTTGKMVMKAGSRRAPCFLADFFDTEAEVLGDLEFWNETEVTLLNIQSLNGTGTNMNSAEVDSLLAANPAFKRLCRSRVVIETTPLIGGDEAESDETKTLTFLGYDTQVSLLVNTRQVNEGPGRRPGGRRVPMEGVERYSWNVSIDSDTVVGQKAFAIPERDTVTIVTRSKDMKSLNMTNSVVLMNTLNGKMVMRAGFRRAPCFLADFIDTEAEVLGDLEFWNDTEISLPTNQFLNGTGTKMDAVEVNVLFGENPSFRRLCRSRVVIETTPLAGPEPETDDTRTFTFLGYDNRVSLLVNTAPVVGGGRRGPGGRRPGGRRGGGRGGRGQGRRPGRRG